MSVAVKRVLADAITIEGRNGDGNHNSE